MSAFWIVIVVLAAVIVIGAVAKLMFGNTNAVDRVRRTDPETAARIEQQRAESALRAGMQGIGGGFG